LYAILKALGIGRGDQVVVPGYTCFAVPSAVCFAGAQPLFADVEPSTFNVSLTTIVAALNSDRSHSVKAILIQHTYGIPAETQPIVSWARERGIATIEDCAHAWGSRYREPSGAWLPVGSLGDAAFFSSQWTKPVSTGLGGWAESSDPKLRARLVRFRSEDCVSPSKADIAVLVAQVGIRKLLAHPRIDWAVKKVYQGLYTRGLVLGTSSKEELRGEMPAGYAKHMSSFQERLLRGCLRDGSIVAHRRYLRNVYDRALEAVTLPTQHVPDGADPVLLRYPVRVGDKTKILAEAKWRGFDIGDWYSHPVDRPESLTDDAIGYQAGSCPEGERAAREVINLPMGRGVTEQLALRMVELLKEFA
jgi:dTDP-4-amino-4,6-dideoxygalactose transaminase